MVKRTLEGEVGGNALNSHGNYILGRGKSWKNHGIVFLNFCGTLFVALLFFFLFQGMWLQLQNAHNAPHLLLLLESMMEEYSTAATPDSQFRIWISAQAIPEAIPVRMLQNSVKALVDTPKVSSGDKNIAILHLSCRMSDLQFSLTLQLHALVL